MAELPVRRERREAAPARWDLFGELEEMRARTEQLFERLLGGDLGFHRGLWSPPVDLEETDEAWVVTAGLLLVRESGGMVSDYDGSEHGLDSRYTLASVPSLAEALQSVVAGAM